MRAVACLPLLRFNSPCLNSPAVAICRRDAQRPLHPREVHQRAHSRQEAREGIFPALSEGPISDRGRELARPPIINIEFTMKRLREPLALSGD